MRGSRPPPSERISNKNVAEKVFAIYGKHGGETGIRTLETPFEAYALSRRARSTAPASLLKKRGKVYVFREE
jgi:hypothetical protein